MSDVEREQGMAAIEIKLDHLTEGQDEIKGKLGEIEDRLDTHSSAIQSLSQWRSGNGAKGAEARLQCAEEVLQEFPAIQADLKVVRAVADAKLEDISSTIRNTLDARDKTVIAYLKAVGSLLGGLAGLAALAAVFLGIFKVMR